MIKNFKNILIIGHSNIGDACYDLAVVAPLRDAYPNAHISFLTSSQSKDLARNFQGLDEIIAFDKHGEHKSFFKLLELIKFLREKRFDLCIVLKKSLFFYFLNIPNVWSLKRSASSKKVDTLKHVVDNYLDLLRSHGVEVKERAEFNFGFDKNELSFADSFFSKNNISPADIVITVGPFSNWSLKCWPIDKWNELIKILVKELNLKVIIVGKSGADLYSREVAEELSTLGISAVNQCSLKESLGLIKRSKLFISSDTSLLHIASCMGVSSIGLYGPTIRTAYYPYFHQDSVIIGANLPICAPCINSNRLAQCKKEVKAPCMDAISVDEVLRAIKNKLNIN